MSNHLYSAIGHLQPRRKQSPVLRAFIAVTATCILVGAIIALVPLPFHEAATAFLPTAWISTGQSNKPVFLPLIANLTDYPDAPDHPIPLLGLDPWPEWVGVPLEIYERAAREGMRVPNIVHYVYLTPGDDIPSGEDFPFLYYLSVRSAMVAQQPEVMILHCNTLPTGPWWDAVASHFIINKVHTFDKIFGNSVSAQAHKSDALRVLALLHYGGIYMDLDTFAVKSLDDLRYAPATMGLQEPSGYKYFCNAFIMAERRSRFMDLWWQSYQEFDDSIWDYNSGQRPYMIAKSHPDDIQALLPEALFLPSWGDATKPLLYNDTDFRGDGHWAYHGWHRSAAGEFAALSPELIRDVDKSFHLLVRPYLDEDTFRIYDAMHS